MIKKLTITVLGIGLLLAIWQLQAQAAVENAQDHENVHQPAQKPATLAPATLAPAIQDALILQGWEYLRSLKEPVQVSNGIVVSGASLAQFLLESQIPVVWGNDGICGGGSCSQLYCGQDASCSYEDGQPGIDPIYLNPDIQTQDIGKMERLVGELGHEIFHRTRPFGTGTITRFEEYWAFFVGTQLVKAGFPKFDGADPMNPDQLEHWFYINGLHGYLRLPAYPGGGGSQVNQASNVGQDLGSE